MRWLPDPVWPVLVLAVVTAADAWLCVRPVRFVAQCFRDVRFPERWWWVMPWIKGAAEVGLVAGIWVPVLGTVTFFVNATGMLLLCVFVLWFSFVR